MMRIYWSFFLLLFSVCLAAEPLTVRVSGLEDDVLANVEAQLSLFRYQNDPTLSSDRIRSLHERAPEEIGTAIAPFGFYNPLVTSSLGKSSSGWLAVYDIDPGPRTHLVSVDIRLMGPGKRHSALQNIVKQSRLTVGAPLEHERYEEFKQELLETARDQGFLDSGYRAHEIAVDRAQNTATIRLYLATGPQHYFGETHYHSEEFDPGFLKRFQSYAIGTPFNTLELMETQNGFIAGDYFSSVMVQPRFEAIEGYAVPIDIHLKAKPKNRYQYGLGFGTDTGVRGLVGWHRPYINRFGHKFQLNARASQKEQDYEARYIVPGKSPVTDHYTWSLSRVQENIDKRKSLKHEAGLSETRQFGRLNRTIGLKFQMESYRDREAVSEESTGLLLPYTTLHYVKRDHAFNPTRGHSVKFSVLGAYDAFLSSTSLAKFDIEGRYLYALNSDTRFLARVELGAIVPKEESDVPVSMRYFAGGDNSIRGFAYQSLGPDGIDGLGRNTIIGGKYLSIAGLECIRHIYGKFSMALFVDGGNAYDRFKETDFQAGAGIGARYASPVGPIRIDFAHPLTDAADEWRYHIRFGAEL